jgi:hypothetical protein
VAVLDDGDEMRKPAAGITLDFDPARVIPLLNPSTGQPTGDETTYGAVYAILYSAYIAAAQERDARNNPPPPADATGRARPGPGPPDTKPDRRSKPLSLTINVPDTLAPQRGGGQPRPQHGDLHRQGPAVLYVRAAVVHLAVDRRQLRAPARTRLSSSAATPKARS